MNPKEEIQLDQGWHVLARLFATNGYFLKQQRRYGPTYLIEVHSTDAAIPNEFFRRLRIGSQPFCVQRYVRKSKSGKKEEAAREWRWRVGKQLEAYWFIVNILRFLRGPKRRKAEVALRAVTDTVTKARELQRLGQVPTLDPVPALPHEKKKGFMTRGPW